MHKILIIIKTSFITSTTAIINITISYSIAITKVNVFLPFHILSFWRISNTFAFDIIIVFINVYLFESTCIPTLSCNTLSFTWFFKYFLNFFLSSTSLSLFMLLMTPFLPSSLSRCPRLMRNHLRFPGLSLGSFLLASDPLLVLTPSWLPELSQVGDLLSQILLQPD